MSATICLNWGNGKADTCTIPLTDEFGTRVLELNAYRDGAMLFPPSPRSPEEGDWDFALTVAELRTLGRACLLMAHILDSRAEPSDA